MSFSSRIQVIRKEYSLSQEKLAEILNVSAREVADWESGAYIPKTNVLIEISNRFNVSLDYLLKDSSDSFYEEPAAAHRPIDLTKPADPAMEIYPEQNIPFKNVAVAEDTDLSRYGNYTPSPSVPPQAPAAGGRTSPPGRRLRRKKPRKEVLTAAVCVFLFLLVSAIVVTAVFESRNRNYEEPYIDYSYSYYDTECMTDEVTGIRYIFDRDFENGIVTSLYDTDISKCVKVRNLITGETFYCSEDYSTNCAVVTHENGNTYVIPYYMLDTYVSVEEQNGYTVCQDQNTKQWYYVPDYIIDECEELYSRYYRLNNAPSGDIAPEPDHEP